MVAARLGHAGSSITLRVSAHVVNEQLAEAADIFAQAVASTSAVSKSISKKPPADGAEGL